MRKLEKDTAEFCTENCLWNGGKRINLVCKDQDDDDERGKVKITGSVEGCILERDERGKVKKNRAVSGATSLPALLSLFLLRMILL